MCIDAVSEEERILAHPMKQTVVFPQCRRDQRQAWRF
jgi:hypothetical protein